MHSHSTVQIPTLSHTLHSMLAAMGNGIDFAADNKYPPHNISCEGEDEFFIEMAIAGFSPEDIDISIEGRTLTVAGVAAKPSTPAQRIFLHRGLAQRDFRRTYRIGEYIVVRGAEIRNGILSVHLVREVPEEAKARKIEIRSVV